jgi:hypothetical protein
MIINLIYFIIFLIFIFLIFLIVKNINIGIKAKNNIKNFKKKVNKNFKK